MSEAINLFPMGDVDATDIPGVFVKDGEAYTEFGGKLFRVTAAVNHKGTLIPVLDIPLVDYPAGGIRIPKKEIQPADVHVREMTCRTCEFNFSGTCCGGDLAGENTGHPHGHQITDEADTCDNWAPSLTAWSAAYDEVQAAVENAAAGGPVSAVPLLDMPMMSDDTWNKKAEESAVRNYTRHFGKPPESVAQACAWQREVVEDLKREHRSAAEGSNNE